MGLFNNIKKAFTGLRYARMLNGSVPIFSQFGDNIYASDIVQSIVACIVDEMTKLRPLHIRTNGNDREPVNSSIQHVLRNPNELMTTADFIEKVVWNLLLNYNSIIYPAYETTTNSDGSKSKRYTGLYPLQPAQVDFLEDESKELFIKLTFKNGYDVTLPYSEVIHVRYQYSFNEFLGGNANGQPDNEALLKLLSMNNQMMEGVLKAMKTSFSITGFLKAGSYLDKDKTDKMVQEFNEQLKTNASGIMGLDGKAEYIPITKNIQPIDPETLKFIDTRILRKFGVSMPILLGDYTKEQYEAFYQKKIEPLIIKFAQAFTKALFTRREKDLGNEVVFMPKALLFLTTTQVLEAVRLLGDAGDLWENEKRMAIGLDPSPELVGIRMQSLNYIRSDMALQYQMKGNEITKKEG